MGERMPVMQVTLSPPVPTTRETTSGRAQQRTGNDHARAKRQVKGAAPVVARVKGGAILQLPSCATPKQGRTGGWAAGSGERRTR